MRAVKARQPWEQWEGGGLGGDRKQHWECAGVTLPRGGKFAAVFDLLQSAVQRPRPLVDICNWRNYVGRDQPQCLHSNYRPLTGILRSESRHNNTIVYGDVQKIKSGLKFKTGFRVKNR